MKVADLIKVFFGNIKVICEDEVHEINNSSYPEEVLEKEIIRIQSSDNYLEVYVK